MGKESIRKEAIVQHLFRELIATICRDLGVS